MMKKAYIFSPKNLVSKWFNKMFLLYMLPAIHGLDLLHPIWKAYNSQQYWLNHSGFAIHIENYLEPRPSTSEGNLEPISSNFAFTYFLIRVFVAF